MSFFNIFRVFTAIAFLYFSWNRGNINGHNNNWQGTLNINKPNEDVKNVSLSILQQNKGLSLTIYAYDYRVPILRYFWSIDTNGKIVKVQDRYISQISPQWLNDQRTECSNNLEDPDLSNMDKAWENLRISCPIQTANLSLPSGSIEINFGTKRLTPRQVKNVQDQIYNLGRYIQKNE